MGSIGYLFEHIIYTEKNCKNFLNQNRCYPKGKCCEKINNVNNDVYGNVLEECYKNSHKRNSGGQLV